MGPFCIFGPFWLALLGWVAFRGLLGLIELFLHVPMFPCSPPPLVCLSPCCLLPIPLFSCSPAPPVPLFSYSPFSCPCSLFSCSCFCLVGLHLPGWAGCGLPGWPGLACLVWAAWACLAGLGLLGRLELGSIQFLLPGVKQDTTGQNRNRNSPEAEQE